MNNRNFESINGFEEYIKETIRLPSEKLFPSYLSKIYSNLLQRESHMNKRKSKKFSFEQKSVFSLTPEKYDSNLSLNVFLD